MFKTVLIVGTAAGLGAFGGKKLYEFVGPKLPAQTPAALRSGAEVGMQAAVGVVAYGVLRSIF